jgi:hypothetical protein
MRPSNTFDVLLRSFGFETIISTVSMNNEGGANSRNTYEVRFGVNEMGLFSLRYGTFDYNRRSQWTLFSMIGIIRISESFD